jgi:hypothetical protein
MNCESFQSLIEEYIDGALDHKSARDVTAHLNSCAACARFREDLVREQQLYSQYDRGLEVSPALWSSIESRIKQDRATRASGTISRMRDRLFGLIAVPRFSTAFAAALVVIAIGVTVAVMSYLNSSSRVATVATNNPDGDHGTAPNNPVPAPGVPEKTPDGKQFVEPAPEKSNPVKVNLAVPRRNEASTATPTPAQLVREAEQKYVTAIAMLTRDVNKRRSQLDPMLLARFDAALTDIDKTIKDTRRVARDNPEDPIALQYLLAAYSKKVDVLREMTASTD